MADDYLSDEDKALFRQTVGAVKPLDKSKRQTLKAKPPLPIVRRRVSVIEKVLPEYTLSNTYIDEVNADAILTYGQQTIPSKRFRQLKTGQIPWQARLDLHGLRPETAGEVLCAFIEKQVALQNRCLLIIHGKGGHRGEAPILKNRLNDWLRQLPSILAFHSALPRDGGSGAVYVLLKRQRGSI